MQHLYNRFSFNMFNLIYICISGDVVLRELLLKASAMDDLGLPFKVVVGKVGKLYDLVNGLHIFR